MKFIAILLAAIGAAAARPVACPPGSSKGASCAVGEPEINSKPTFTTVACPPGSPKDAVCAVDIPEYRTLPEGKDKRAMSTVYVTSTTGTTTIHKPSTTEDVTKTVVVTETA